MNLLATLKIPILLAGLSLVVPCHASEIEAVDGPNVRTMKHEDGSNAVFVRSPDGRTITKKTFKNGVLTMVTAYRMNSNGDPTGCKIQDGLGNEMFKVAYGYHRVTGQLVSELMYDSRVKRINKDTQKEMPVQEIKYLYDAEGKRSAPFVFNLLPGKYFEEVFGQKSTALDNPFR